MYPEQLLTRRYTLQSELWGVGQELARLDREAKPLLDELRRVTHRGGVRQQLLNDQLHPIRARIKILREQQWGKRKELTDVEAQLRETFKAAGHSLASGSRQAVGDSDRPAGDITSRAPEDPFIYDLFISHATEDKDEVVRPLVSSLTELGLQVWYDETALKIGDSLRQSIDRGLTTSRFGIVIISPSFIKKGWTAYELDGLVAREVESGKVILPIWHKVTKDEVLRFSPKLADKIALHTATTTIFDMALEIAIAIYGGAG